MRAAINRLETEPNPSLFWLLVCPLAEELKPCPEARAALFSKKKKIVSLLQ
jgi:hypothetical protein